MWCEILLQVAGSIKVIQEAAEAVRDASSRRAAESGIPPREEPVNIRNRQLPQCLRPRAFTQPSQE